MNHDNGISRNRLEQGRSLLLAIGLIGIASSAWAQNRVVDTVHNLSAGGPGQVRAVSERQVCIFCHAPHNTSGLRPLWNRELPTSNYLIYQSSTLDAQPGQPTGASKLCLSCHDGTIALGQVLSRTDRIRMVGGEFIPAGLSNLGTDLSDDHPISFVYTSGLAASDRQLVDPSTLPDEVPLDAAGELQCTSCHDPHNNTHGDFLVLRQQYGELCRACHDMTGWQDASHRTSSAQVGGSQTTDWPYSSVGENACRACHRSHTAAGKERLLIHENEEDNCLDCHGGQGAGKNVLTDINKISAHDPRRYLHKHDPAEEPLISEAHVECSDCHNPHAAASQPPQHVYIPIGDTMRDVRGVSIGGVGVDRATYEYEVCFRCHGDTAVEVPRRIYRQSETANLRLKFSPSNPSYHPVAQASPSFFSPSLVPGLAEGSLIRCTDCHNSDTGRQGGGANGPHGSIYDFLLERNYSTRDNTTESSFEYAMCYKCHERSSILSDESFPLHSLHLEENTPCSACHDPHGITLTRPTPSDHTHLINFDVLIVRPYNGQMIYRDDGMGAGSCTLTCHGEEHDNLTYRR
ncbi:MAG: hypothetical protein J5J06_19105 [Phycisphaerae bacterium]|nr:hypothetical protein [Phycisphaerae bacterium]